MPAEPTYRVTNLRNHPVELHVGSETVVIAPLGEEEVTRVTAQVDELVRRALVTVEPVARAPAKTAAKKAAETTTAPRKQPAATKAATKKKAPAAKQPARPSSASHPARRGGN